jgi:LmeA-like phospholipid-binding
MLVVLAVVVAAAAAGADRLVAFLAVRRVSRIIGTAFSAASPALVRIGGGLFLPQLLSGVYRQADVTLKAFSAGGVEFSGINARLTGVRAPLRHLVRGGSVVADHVTATAAVPLSALRSRLPPGLTLRRQGDSLAVVAALPTPVSGVLAITCDARHIVITPRVLGIPSLVGFAIALGSMPPELAIDDVVVTDAGLTVSMRGQNVALAGRHRER